MGRKFDSAEQRLAAEYGRVDKGKRKAARRVFRRAVKLSGMSRHEFAAALQVHDEEAMGFMRAAASANDKWMKHFIPETFQPNQPREERDWEGFFSALMDCVERFLPLILAI